MGLAATSGKNIRRHLDYLRDEIKKIQPPALSEPIQPALADFETAFQKIEKEIVPADILAYQTPWSDALRGGTPSLQLLSLGSSIANFPSVPTDTELIQLKDIIARMDSNISKLNQIIRADLPRLNQLLSENKLKPFPKIEEVPL